MDLTTEAGLKELLEDLKAELRETGSLWPSLWITVPDPKEDLEGEQLIMPNLAMAGIPPSILLHSVGRLYRGRPVRAVTVAIDGYLHLRSEQQPLPSGDLADAPGVREALSITTMGAGGVVIALACAYEREPSLEHELPTFAFDEPLISAEARAVGLEAFWEGAGVLIPSRN